MLRTAVHTIIIARGATVAQTTIIGQNKIEQNIAKKARVLPGQVVDLTQDELDYLNEHAPRSIRKPTQDEIAAYKLNGGKEGEAVSAKVDDKQSTVTPEKVASADETQPPAGDAAADKSDKKADKKADGSDGL